MSDESNAVEDVDTNETQEIPEELLEGSEEGSVDMDALNALINKEPEKSPIEKEAERIEKELNQEYEEFDPVATLEKELKDAQSKEEDEDTLEKEGKDHQELSDKDKSEEDDKEDKGEVEKVEPLSHKELVEVLDNSGLKIEKIVDGEKVVVDASEVINKALNDYSGHEAVEKRFSELDKKTKNFHNDVEKVSSMIESFSSRFKANDFFGGLEALAEVAGVPAYALKESAIHAVAPELEKRADLSESEIQNKLLVEQNKYFQKLNESEAQKRAAKQEELENYKLDTYFENLRKTHDVTEEEWEAAFQELDKTLPEGQKILAQDVLNEVNSMKDFQALDTKIGPTLDMLGEDAPEEITETLVEMYEQYPDFTPQDFIDITKESIDEVVGEEEAGKTAKNVSKALTDKVAKGAKVESQGQTTNSSLDSFVKKFQESLNEEDNWNS